MNKNLKKIFKMAATGWALGIGLLPAEVSVIWDFSPGNENGWTTVNGVSWLDNNGVTAGQLNGGGILDYFGGINSSGNTRRAHDGAHVNFLYRSPVLNFGLVNETETVLEVDWVGGDGDDGGTAPLNPNEIIGGSTTPSGQKGLALLNLTTGNYDAFIYKEGNSTPISTNSFTRTQLTAAGVTLDDDYQLDFFENDDGGWGWTTMSQVRLDAAAISGPTVFWDFDDQQGGNFGWKVENGFANLATDGVEASVNGTDLAGDNPHPTLLFRSPEIRFSVARETEEVIQASFIGGQGNQDSSVEPADPAEVLAFNGGNSTSNGQKGLALLNVDTGLYEYFVYDSQDGGASPETIVVTYAELTAAGLDLNATYRFDFFDHDDGSAGWTRLESVNFKGLVVPPPNRADLVWDFSPGVENGWITINGVSWLEPDGVEAGQANGIGGNVSGNTVRAADGAHTNFIYRSPIVNFTNAAVEGIVVAFDFIGGAGNQESAADPTNPQTVIDSGTGITSAVGQKAIGFLNLASGQYDAAFYDPENGGDTQTVSLTLNDLVFAGIDPDADYQMDFLDNDDGGWGWTRLSEVRIDTDAVPSAIAGSIQVTSFNYAPESNTLTLSWDSVEGTAYEVQYSTDLNDWSASLDNGVPGDAGTETTRAFNLGTVGLGNPIRLFVRVRLAPPAG